MRAILMAAVVANGASAAEPGEAMALRARAALALAFAPPTYAEQHAKALKDGKPLVVFVGQPAKPVAGCVCVACETFPDVTGAAVVVGLPDRGSLRRLDVPGTPTEEAIRSATAVTPGNLVAKLPAK